MAGNEYTINRNRWVAALLFSLCLHILLILIFWNWNDILVHRAKIEKQPEDIVFEFLERPEPRMLTETGESSKIPPDQADFLSDKDARAQDMNPSTGPDSRMPFMEGDVALGSIRPLPQYTEQSPSEPQPQDREAEPVDPEGIEVRERSRSSRNAFDRDHLLGIQRPAQTRLPEPSYRELQSSVERNGGISFNTYAWEWAPYLLKLKDLIQKNIFPPASFTRLGFGGSHLIRFRIARDGRLTGPHILGSDGDRVLTETSSKAITLSAPFPPLPDDFPESFLEVTVLFQYYGKESR